MSLPGFQDKYSAPGCLDDHLETNRTDSANSTSANVLAAVGCQREDSLLFLILMLGTLWLSLRVFKFNQR